MQVENSYCAHNGYYDHLILAKKRGEVRFSCLSNLRRFCFLSSVSIYGIGFWKPGSGIIHQIVLENYAFQVNDDWYRFTY
jgi:aconitase A